jgi:hypothetical protein
MSILRKPIGLPQEHARSAESCRRRFGAVAGCFRERQEPLPPITIILNREFLSLVDRMKYSQLRRGLSPDDAAAYVGSKELLRQFERARWLKPFISGNRLTRFDIRDLDTCIDRLKAGEALASAPATTATL